MTDKIRLIIGFVLTWPTSRVLYIEQHLITIQVHMRSPPVLAGFVLLNLFLWPILFTVIFVWSFLVCLAMVLSVFFSTYDLNLPLKLTAPYVSLFITKQACYSVQIQNKSIVLNQAILLDMSLHSMKKEYLVSNKAKTFCKRPTDFIAEICVIQL